MIRAFIAVEIEDSDVLSRIVKVKNEIASSGADVKPVEDENIHLTLRFLGEFPESDLSIVQGVMEDLKRFRNFKMHIKGVGVFPSILRPRVVWVGVSEGSDQLRAIRRAIDTGLVGGSFHRDQHEFTPHITLARVRGSRNIDRLIDVVNMFRDHDFGWSPVTRVVLKRSTLTPRGPIYSDIMGVDLVE